MSSILFMALKDLRILMRDKFGLFWVFAFPLLMALFFGSIFSSSGSGTNKLRIAAVNESNLENAKAFVEHLEQSDALSVHRLPRDSAQALVGRGKLVAYVALSDSSGDSKSSFPGGMPSIEVGIDPARKAEAGYLQGLVTQAYFTLLQQQITDPVKSHKWIQDGLRGIDSSSNLPDSDKSMLRSFLSSLDEFNQFVATSDSSGLSSKSPFASADIKMVEVTVDIDMPHSSFEITFPQALSWGLLGVTLAFALSIVQERTKGTYLRLRIAPITRSQILAGKGLASFIACMAVCIILMAIAVTIFNVRIVNKPGLVLAILSSAICFSGIVMLISVLGKTEQSVAGAGWAIMLVQAMVGGGMVPLMVMPSWMLTLSNFSAVKWSIYALEGAIWRGFSVGDMIMPMGILVMAGIVTFSVGVVVLVRFDR